MSESRQTEIMESTAREIKVDRTTGTSTLSTTLAPGQKWALREIRIHLSAAGGAANFTATMDSGTNAAYDSVVLSQDMTSVTDLEWQPDFPMTFDDGDELDFAWANGSGRTYGLEVIYSLL